jgi:hypothetical protein
VTDDGLWLVQVEDSYGARWVPIPVPVLDRDRRFKIACPKCGAEPRRIFAVARAGGHFEHECAPKRRGSLRIW